MPPLILSAGWVDESDSESEGKRCEVREQPWRGGQPTDQLLSLITKGGGQAGVCFQAPI